MTTKYKSNTNIQKYEKLQNTKIFVVSYFRIHFVFCSHLSLVIDKQVFYCFY